MDATKGKPFADLNILLLDDDEGDRESVKRVLTQAGLRGECTEAVSVEDALAACETRTFDCAIVDYQLPGEDGLAAITALHGQFPYMALIMATGRGDEIVATKAMLQGA